MTEPEPMPATTPRTAAGRIVFALVLLVVAVPLLAITTCGLVFTVSGLLAALRGAPPGLYTSLPLAIGSLVVGGSALWWIVKQLVRTLGAARPADAP